MTMWLSFLGSSVIVAATSPYFSSSSWSFKICVCVLSMRCRIHFHQQKLIR